jgi:hypothetical protein
LGERCCLDLVLPRFCRHGDEPIPILRHRCLAAFVEQVGRAREAVEILAPLGLELGRRLELPELLDLLPEQRRELREELADAPVRLR